MAHPLMLPYQYGTPSLSIAEQHQKGGISAFQINPPPLDPSDRPAARELLTCLQDRRGAVNPRGRQEVTPE